MSSEAVVMYYWRVTLKGHLRAGIVKGVDLTHAKGKGERIGKVLSVERLMPVKKGRGKGYSFPTTFWQEGEEA